MSNATAFMGIGMAVFGIVWLLTLALGILVLVAEWHVFKKAGRHGWAAIVPFYNMYVLSDIVWGNGWLFLLLFIPIGNIVFGICTFIKLARSFGKSGAFGAGLVFFPFIFMPMLGFGKAEYEGPAQSGKKGMIIATAITGVVGTILLIALVSIGAMAIQSVPDYDDYTSSSNLPVTDDDLLEDDLTSDNPTDDLDTDDANDTDDTEQVITGDPVENHPDFVMATMNNGRSSIQVPLMNKETASYGDGSMLTAAAPGISIELSYGFGVDSDPAAEVASSVEIAMSVFADLTNFYKDVTPSEMITGDGFALQQISYNYLGFDGELYPCVRLIKCDIVEGYPVISDITLDTSDADDNTLSLFESACAVYGIDFQFAE